MGDQVQAALIAAITSIVVSGGIALWDRLTKRREEQHQTQRKYLLPLEEACRVLLKYFNELINRIERESPGTVRAPFVEVQQQHRKPEFSRNCNDYLCNAVGTLYATARFFAYAAKLLNDLPLVRISRDDAERLKEATANVGNQLGRGGPGAFWPELQDSIGKLVTDQRGEVIPYTAFCKALSADDDSYFRLFNFYVDIELKKNYQLLWGRDALKELHDVLVPILSPHSVPWRLSPRTPGARSDPAHHATNTEQEHAVAT